MHFECTESIPECLDTENFKVRGPSYLLHNGLGEHKGDCPHCALLSSGTCPCVPIMRALQAYFFSRGRAKEYSKSVSLALAWLK